MKKKCDMCGEKKEGTTCIIYIPNKKDNFPFYNSGYNLFVCKECFMCYLSQYMEMSNKEITEGCNWIHRDVIRQGRNK